MTAPTPSRPTRTPAGEVDALMAALDHPGKDGIELLRQAILGIDPHIREEVKWNAPSFRLEDHFATFKLHPPGRIQLVLHTGAKPQRPPRSFALTGADALVKWAAADRCVITLAGTEAAREHRHQVVDLVGQWIRQL